MFSTTTWRNHLVGLGRSSRLKLVASSVLTPMMVATAAVSCFLLTSSLALSVLIVLIYLGGVAYQIGLKSSVGVFLLLIPLQWLTITLLQYVGFSQYKAVSALKELILVVAMTWFLSHTPRLRLAVPDTVLIAALVIVGFDQLFHLDITGMRDDWEWVIIYVVGRGIRLPPSVEAMWAKSAVWMCAVLSIAGVWEVLVLGSGPRLLMLKATSDQAVGSMYRATGYNGLRAASTMVGPVAFAGLCVVALVLWWAYMKNVFPAILIGAGLLATVTRSGVIAAVAGLIILGIRRKERVRLAFFGCLAIVGLIVAIQTLDLNHFLAATFTEGADTSKIGHVQTVTEGISALVDHPLGLGAGTIGQRRLVVDPHAMNPESSFIAIALEYGILAGVLYVGFFISCLWSLFKVRQPLGDAAFSILLGYGVLLAVGPIHFDIPLACWVWIPVGMGVTRLGDISQRRAASSRERLLIGSTNAQVYER